MPPKTRGQRKRESAVEPNGEDREDIVPMDPSLKPKGKGKGGRQQRIPRQPSQSEAESGEETEVSESANHSVFDSIDDLIKKIEVLESQINDIKSKRALELLEETEREELLVQEVAQLHEDQNKLDADDPASKEIGEKLEQKKKELKQYAKVCKRMEIMYELEFSQKTTQLNSYRNQLYNRQRQEAHGTESEISSVNSSQKRRATKSWVDAQRIAQEEEDLKLATQLQEDLDKELKELERLKVITEEKKLKIQAIKTPSVCGAGSMPPPTTNYRRREYNSQANPEYRDHLLETMFARQGSSKDLPFFNGSPEQWIRFKNEFERTTRQCGFSDSENLSRLEKALKGEALASVKSLMFTEANVPVILKKLEKIFGNPEIIINNLIDEVERLPAVKEGRPDIMIEFGTAVVNLTANVQALSRSEHLNNPRLVKDLQGKLPYQEELRWISYSKQNGRNLLAFSDWIEEEVENARMSGHNKATKPSAGHFERRERDSRNKFQRNSGRCLVTTDKPEYKKEFKKEENKFKNNRPCFVCEKEGHWTSNCKTLLSKKPEERFNLVMEKRLCTSCLVFGHRIKDCRRKKICGINGCKREHHSILHKDEAEPFKQTEPATKAKDVTEEIAHSLNTGGDTHMGALPIILSGPEGEIQCLAFIDPGSTVTLLKEEIAEKLGLQGPRQPFCLKTLNSDKRHGDSRVTSLGVRGAWKKSKIFKIDGVRTVEQMPIGRLTQNAEDLRNKYPYLRHVPLPTFSNQEPGILIGMREIHLIDTIKSIGDRQDAPRAMKCHLGWRLGGATSKRNVVEQFHTCNKTEVEDTLEELVRKSFTTEDFGVKELPTLLSTENEKCIKIMEETTKRVPGTDRYETGLLWRDPDVVLPASRETALHRLYCQEKKMDKDPAFAAAYCGKFNENYKKGFYRKLSPQQAAERTSKTWYLSHFGVFNPNKPGKIRMVMDAKAKSKGISLNDCLMSGPDFNNSLTAVLWRSRQYQHAYAGDIKDMYHRVYIKEDERCCQRLLWRDMDRINPPDEYEMIVLTFGSTCSPASAQFVKRKNADENRTEFPEASEAINTEMYVDDVIGSKPSLMEAQQVVKDIIAVNLKAGFLTCNWNANNPKILEGIDDELKCVEIREIGERDENAAERVLGMWWDSRKDDYTYRLKMHKVPKEILEKKKRPTKRDVLRVTMSVFDPLGLVAHLSIKPKILIQALWTKGIGWDEEIPEDLLRRWNAWLDELKELSNVRIPRCYSENIPIAESVDLHVFCDASEKAFATIVFTRVKSVNGIDVNLFGAKTRVAPLKVLSIPRLELQAAVMGTRLARAIKEQLTIKIHNTIFWTDSQTVLKWLRSDARDFKPFVSHRIGEILDSTLVSQWRYIPTKLNVADDATRNNEPSDLSATSRWFRGPAFLQEDESEWPKEKEIESMSDNNPDLEMRAVVLVTSAEPSLIDFSRFSRFQRIRRTMALVCRLAAGWVHCSNKEYSVLELQNAEKQLVRLCQRETFAEEMRCLNGGKLNVDKKSQISSLEPFIDKYGIMRVKGRLNRSKKDEDYRQPAILDGNHHFTRLLLQWFHEQCGHQGQRTVAYLIRQKYWILGGMTTIKRTFHKCLQCQKRKLKICKTRMSDLPFSRLQIVRPFHNTGMDYFGPMIIKIGRRNEKRWGVIFTCLATRAVHLEVAHSLSTDSAIIAVMGLSSRRGRPQRIYSDNGTNFHGAHNELKKALEEINPKEMMSRLAAKEIQWYFNPPAAPHMGGSWERLVGSTKRTMEGIMKDQHPTDETLKGVFFEVEYILNSRPLLEVPVDPADPEAITPNHILIGWQGGTEHPEVNVPVWGEFVDRDLWSRKSWKVAQRLADQFWSRWQKEYLPTLNKRPKWIQTKEPVREDDIVLVVDDAAPRNTWPLGRIIATFPGKDGEIRMVDVRTAAGIYRRPTSKLVKLQVGLDEASSSGGRMWGRRQGKGNEENIESQISQQPSLTSIESLGAK